MIYTPLRIDRTLFFKMNKSILNTIMFFSNIAVDNIIFGVVSSEVVLLSVNFCIWGCIYFIYFYRQSRHDIDYYWLYLL